jgi:hypothetical protein
MDEASCVRRNAVRRAIVSGEELVYSDIIPVRIKMATVCKQPVEKNAGKKSFNWLLLSRAKRFFYIGT